jgi:hypothetical protein
LCNRHGFKRYAFADPLKQIVSEIESNQSIEANCRLRRLIEAILTASNVKISEHEISEIFKILDKLKQENPTKKIWNIGSVLKFVFTRKQPKIVKNRGLLQSVGMFFRNNYDEDIWIKYLYRKIEKESKNSNIVIDDTRLKNEFLYFTARGFKAIRMNCGLENRLHRMQVRDGMAPTVSQLEHISETDLDGVRVERACEISNNSSIGEMLSDVDRIIDTEESIWA